MDIILKARNCDVPSRLKDEARTRIGHAARFYDRLVHVEVLFAEEHNPRIAAPALVELTGRTKGHVIRALGAADDHRAALDVAVGRFERQLSRYKARVVARSRRGGPLPVGAATAAAAPSTAPNATRNASPPDDDAPSIVRRKEFALTPLMPEDAALQLELLDHGFYLFQNAATGRCSVVYRRRDGDLGLIEALHAG